MTPSRPRDERRTRRIVAGAVALIVLAGATTGVVRSYQHRQDQLRAARNELRQSLAHETLLRGQLAAARTATHTARAATAGDRLSTATEQTGIRRVALETLAAAHDADIARQSLQQTTQQRLQLGNAANQVQTCMNAERTTMQHINTGNRAAAASDLNAGKTACSNALADATGSALPVRLPRPVHVERRRALLRVLDERRRRRRAGDHVDEPEGLDIRRQRARGTAVVGNPGQHVGSRGVARARDTDATGRLRHVLHGA